MYNGEQSFFIKIHLINYSGKVDFTLFYHRNRVIIVENNFQRGTFSLTCP